METSEKSSRVDGSIGDEFSDLDASDYAFNDNKGRDGSGGNSAALGGDPDRSGTAGTEPNTSDVGHDVGQSTPGQYQLNEVDMSSFDDSEGESIDSQT